MKKILCTSFAVLLLVGCSQKESQPLDAPAPAHEHHNNLETITLPVENWQSLFDGETLEGWTVPIYAGDGEVEVKDGNISIGRGELATGIRYTKEFPKIDYEIRYEAQRTDGYDFFAACTFPVGESFCTFVNGGWGGSTVGLSSIDGYDASDNNTSSSYNFTEKTWYRFRIQVSRSHIRVWITPQDKEGNWEEEETIVDFQREEETKLSTRMEMDLYKPLGICTWATGGLIRNIEYRMMGR